MKPRRKYDQEFKQMAVELSKHRESILLLAAELDIKPEFCLIQHKITMAVT